MVKIQSIRNWNVQSSMKHLCHSTLSQGSVIIAKEGVGKNCKIHMQWKTATKKCSSDTDLHKLKPDNNQALYEVTNEL